MRAPRATAEQNEMTEGVYPARMLGAGKKWAVRPGRTARGGQGENSEEQAQAELHAARQVSAAGMKETG